MELGLGLMSKCLTAEQAAPVVRIFANFEYPYKEEEKDHCILSASRFCEWRTALEPISHYMAVSLVRRPSHYHVAHDASTKGKLAIFHMPWGALVFVPSPHRVLLLCSLLQRPQKRQGLRVGLLVARGECHGAEVRV